MKTAMLNGKSHLIFEKCVFWKWNYISSCLLLKSRDVLKNICLIHIYSKCLCGIMVLSLVFCAGDPGPIPLQCLSFFHMIIFSKKVSFYSCFLPNYCKGLNSNPISAGLGCFWPQQQKTAWLFHTFVAKLAKIHNFFYFSL